MRHKFLCLSNLLSLAFWSLLAAAGTFTSQSVANDDIDTRGLVTELGPAPLSFLVNGTTVTTTLQTDFDGDGNGFSNYSDVQVGMQVDVRGLPGAGGSIVAERVKLREPGSGREGGGTNRFRGVITSLDLSSNTLTVNGLHILITPYTGVFGHEQEESPISISNLAIGMVVQVGGTPLPSGEILAGKIEIEEDDFDDDHGGENGHGGHGGHLVFNLKFKGHISFVTTETQALHINGKTILTNEFTRIEDENENTIPFSALVRGDRVEVKANQAPDGSIVAVKIEKIGAENAESEFRGVIQGVDYERHIIVVNAHNILTTTATLILDHFNVPINFADLQAGQFVEVEGRNLNNDGFVAAKIKLEDRIGDDGVPVDELRVKGLIQTLNVAGQSLTVRGFTVSVTSTTRILNRVKQPILLSQLQVGQVVEVEGAPGVEPQTIIAAKIKLEDGLHAEDGDHVIICGAIHPESEVEHEIEHEHEDEHEDENEHGGGHGGGHGEDRGDDKAGTIVIQVGSWLVEVSPTTIMTDRYGEPVTLDNLQLGDFAIVAGTPLAGGHISARSVQREDQFFVPRLAEASARGGWANYE